MNIMTGFLLRLPVFGPLVGKCFIPRIKAMYEALVIRDDYIGELIKSKRAELQRDDFQLTDGFGILIDRTLLNIIYVIRLMD